MLGGWCIDRVLQWVLPLGVVSSRLGQVRFLDLVAVIRLPRDGFVDRASTHRCLQSDVRHCCPGAIGAQLLVGTNSSVPNAHCARFWPGTLSAATPSAASQSLKRFGFFRGSLDSANCRPLCFMHLADHNWNGMSTVFCSRGLVGTSTDEQAEVLASLVLFFKRGVSRARTAYIVR